MEYQIGDKVRIREDLVPFYAYGGISVFPEMLSASGKVITIRGCRGWGDYEMSNGYFYSPEMFDQNYKPESENYMKTSEFRAELEKMGYTFEMSNGYCYTSEMFDQNWKEDKFMKTSEFKAELRKMGYTFEGNNVMNEQNLAMAWISLVCVNMIVTTYGREVSPKLFSLITKYAATPIAEREDEPKLFNVQIIKGKWGRSSWLYRDATDEISTAISEDNNELDQQWTLEQIKEYGIDNETVYKRVPVEVEE